MKKFADITTKEELLERVYNGVLSVGNKSYIEKFLDKEPKGDNSIEVLFVKTATIGCYKDKRYINL